MSAATAHWETCNRCNYDMHMCPGCGEPLPHGTEVCTACLAKHAEPGGAA